MTPDQTRETPASLGYIQPAEWEKHDACWLAWPSHGDLWKEDLEPAQGEFAALCREIIDLDPSTQKPRGEALEILFPNDEAKTKAAHVLKDLPVRFHPIPFGDIWLRDTAPIFLRGRDGTLASACFSFNGWGGKYVLPFDDQVAGKISKASGLRNFRLDWVLEGGSVEVDGEGTCLTSRQCLLNPNRNPGFSEATIEERLQESFGVSKVLWVDQGLLNDHTDGHIDTIARFVAPGVVACMQARSKDDPNARVMDEIARDLEAMTDARGRKLKVVRIPSPGKIQDEAGKIMPASYLNFYIGNTTVVVPIYGSTWDDEAVKEIGKLFPDRRTIGRSAIAILSGGGAFHCITQQVPRSRI